MSQFSTIDSQMMAALSREARSATRRRKNANFHTDNAAVCHRLLNAVEPDSYIPPHRHLSPDKAETIIVLAGRVGVLAFDDKGLVTMRRILAPTSGTVGGTTRCSPRKASAWPGWDAGSGIGGEVWWLC